MITKRRSATDVWYTKQLTRPVYCSDYRLKQHAIIAIQMGLPFPTESLADFISHLPGTWPVMVNFIH